MRTSIVALVLGGALLVGCVAGGGLGGGSVTSVLQGAVKVRGPQGYCPDPSATHETEDSAIVLMGRCQVDPKVKPAVVTVAVGRAGSAGVMAAGGAGLAAFFTSPEGLATLSRSGKAADIRLIEALSSGDAFVMRLQDRGEPSYWRAVLGVKGRLVSLTAKGSAEAPLSEPDGRAILQDAVVAMQRANRG